MNEHEPGRTLDALIAEKVMGLTLSPDKKYYYEDGIMAVDRLNPLVPKYSTDIADAWLVVEKMKMYEPEISWNDSEHAWICIFWKLPEHRSMVSSTSAPHAISLAALRAVENGVKEFEGVKEMTEQPKFPPRKIEYVTTQSVISDALHATNAVEYLSLAEHEHLIREAKAQAFKEGYREAEEIGRQEVSTLRAGVEE